MNERVHAFLIVVDKYHEANSEQRRGQAFFNVLVEIDTLTAEAIRGTPLDPFHRSERVPALVEWLTERWAVQ